MAPQTEILLVVPEQMVCEGLRSLIETRTALVVASEVHSPDDALQMLGTVDPGIILMDVGEVDMSCLTAIRKIREQHPETRVLALSSSATRPRVMQVLEAGAAGYVLKSASFAELARAVEAVSCGESYLSPEVASIVVENSLRRNDRRPTASELSPREREVLQFLADGLTSPQIAEKLALSASTIDTHRKNIMRKLGIRSIAELTKYAIRTGLTSLE